MKKHFFKFGLSAAVLLILITGCGDAADKTTDATTADGTTTQQSSSSNANDSRLKKLSDLVNKNVPVKVDEMTTLTGTSVPSPNTLQYEYKVEQVVKADLDETKMPGIIESAKPDLIQNAKTNSEMELLRELNTKLIYLYKDVNGDELYRIEVKGDEY